MITSLPGFSGGDPIQEHTRIAVRHVVNRFIAGESLAAVADDYDMSMDEAEECLRFHLRTPVELEVW